MNDLMRPALYNAKHQIVPLRKINRSINGNAVVIAKEFLGEYFMYKVSINGENLRVRTNINNLLNIGDKCILTTNKDSLVYLYPGGHKIYI